MCARDCCTAGPCGDVQPVHQAATGVPWKQALPAMWQACVRLLNAMTPSCLAHTMRTDVGAHVWIDQI